VVGSGGSLNPKQAFCNNPSSCGEREVVGGGQEVVGRKSGG